MLFSWLPGREGRMRTASAAMAALAISALLWGMVEVRVVSPARLPERKAGILAMPAGPEAVEWQVRCDEAGPFPSRFDPSTLALESAEMDRLSGSLGRLGGHYQAVMRQFPEEPVELYPPAASKGERVLPERAIIFGKSPDRVGVLCPQLHILARLPSEAGPLTLPPYTGDGTVETGSSWRFVVRVGESGRVRDCIPVVGGDANVPAGVENWTRSIRFGRKAAVAGWFGVDVVFCIGHD